MREKSCGFTAKREMKSEKDVLALNCSSFKTSAKDNCRASADMFARGGGEDREHSMTTSMNPFQQSYTCRFLWFRQWFSNLRGKSSAACHDSLKVFKRFMTHSKDKKKNSFLKRKRSFSCCIRSRKLFILVKERLKAMFEKKI